jgi:hypothetical protein
MKSVCFAMLLLAATSASGVTQESEDEAGVSGD